VRYRTAAISCFSLIGGMFAVPALIWSVFLPSLRQGLPNPIPTYERALLGIAAFCDIWKWLLALPILGLGLIFTLVAIASALRGRNGKVVPRSLSTSPSSGR
jgi:hypothetical protein